jgi:hypothetical protein
MMRDVVGQSMGWLQNSPPVCVMWKLEIARLAGGFDTRNWKRARRAVEFLKAA